MKTTILALYIVDFCNFHYGTLRKIPGNLSLPYSKTRLSYERIAEGMNRSEDHTQYDTILFLGSLDVVFNVAAFRMTGLFAPLA